MNAPPNIDPVTRYSDSDVVHWLTNDTRDERFIDNIFAELCVRLQRAGIPLKRVVAPSPDTASPMAWRADWRRSAHHATHDSHHSATR